MDTIDDFFIPPTYDRFFKYLFTSTGKLHLLEDFINAVLVDSHEEPVHITDLRIADSIAETAYDKKTILDIRAEDSNKHEYNVEVQVLKQDNFMHRSLYYWAQRYTASIKKSDGFDKLRPVICINVLDFELFNKEDIPLWHSCYTARDELYPKYALTTNFSLHFIELPKLFTGKARHTTTMHRLQLWAEYFMSKKEYDMKTLLEKTDDPIFQEAYETYQSYTQNDFERELAFKERMMEHDRITYISEAETRGRAEGKLEGIEKGMQKGMQKGKLEGKLEGIQEGMAIVARNMKTLGLDTSIIANATGLSIQEIESL